MTTTTAANQVTVTAAGITETFTITVPGAFVLLVDDCGYNAGEGSTLVEAIADAEAMLTREADAARWDAYSYEDESGVADVTLTA